MASRPIRADGGRPRSTIRLKSLLALLIAVGGLGSITVSGTYALLLSEEANPNSTIASGTLTLGNTANSGTTCFSSAAGTTGNVNNACSALMTASTLRYPSASATTAQIQIKNTGSLDASDLSIYMPSCAMATSPGATGHTNGGNPCAGIFTSGTPTGVQMTLQETDSVGTPTTCWFPVTAAGACAAAPGYAAAIPNSFGTFATYITSTAAALDLGRGPAHDQIRYFVVGVGLPTNASNTLQGEQATFALTWHLTT